LQAGNLFDLILGEDGVNGVLKSFDLLHRFRQFLPCRAGPSIFPPSNHRVADLPLGTRAQQVHRGVDSIELIDFRVAHSHASLIITIPEPPSYLAPPPPPRFAVPALPP